MLNLKIEEREVVVKKTIYICGDGTEFEDRYDATKHEYTNIYKKLLTNAVYKYPEDKFYDKSGLYEEIKTGLFHLETKDDYENLKQIYEDYKNDYLIKFDSEDENLTFPCDILYLDFLKAYVEITEDLKKIIKKMIKCNSENHIPEEFGIEEIPQKRDSKYTAKHSGEKLFKTKYDAREKECKAFYKYVPKFILQKDDDGIGAAYFYILNESELNMLSDTIETHLEQCFDIRKIDVLSYPAYIKYNGYEGKGDILEKSEFEILEKISKIKIIKKEG